MPILVSLAALPALAAATPRNCLGSLPVGTFRLTVQPAGGGPALPVRSVNTITAGQKLSYQPVHLSAENQSKAQIALIMVPAGEKADSELSILDPVPAAKPASWTVEKNTSVVALVFGPQGLSMKKVRNLMEKNQEILSELADYADQNARVESLVQTLAESERSGGNLNAALSGFGAKYGVAMPRLDRTATTDQQASVLLQALLPAVNSYDPLAPRQNVMQQSAGLAASVAGMFLGNPVILAAGGASLVQNLHTLMFPGTEFRSAFAQSANDSLALCANKQESKSHTRLAYLWAHRIPAFPQPSLALAGDVHLPLGAKSLLRLKEGAGIKGLDRAREWELVPTGKDQPRVPVSVSVEAASNSLAVDLIKSTAKPGEYTLTALWDWTPLPVSGKVFLHPFSNLKAAQLTPRSRGLLAEGNGKVTVELAGADFQFLEKLAIEKVEKNPPAPLELSFTLPRGKRAGEQLSVETEVDTAAFHRGTYRLLLTQSDGVTYQLPVEVLPPNPKIANLPLRANQGETQQGFVLKGTGLDRVESLLSDAGEFQLGAVSGPDTRPVVFKLGSSVRKGDKVAVRMKIRDVQDPLEFPAALEIAGPRPRISVARNSQAREDGVALRPDETPAGALASYALTVENIEGTPQLDVSCAGGQNLRQTISLLPGDRSHGMKLDLAGQGMLFLSLDPGVIGQPGCKLTATVSTAAAGASDPYPLGQVVRVPRIEQFILTDEKAGDALYYGTLKGQDLETIDKTGWNVQDGQPVQSIPAPAPGEPQKQVLRVVLSWPAPSPHAPVFVWLRGEAQGRPTRARF